ncbi:aldolase [Croceicoccus ponticola]|uniref:3-oxo-tetronate 4-phosphate decarboxylase n=1 Tax=Croceicoccus ponticola TaxID=2217664 RepID=A0A437GU05_9SPHN|nr:3-oxo-tetronate 4-phosphate decarboxylase [Croceicoccus ponticola]RVQ64623.1 aldolase [Croceicoccus ponticola]
MTESQLREAICDLGRSLFERGYTHGASGNLSVRLDDGSFLVTPTNVSLGILDPTCLAHLDATGRHLEGPLPTKEVALHAALYRTRRGSGAVVHLHSTHSVAVSMLPDLDPADALPPLTAYQLMKVGRTAILPYFRPGDPAMGDAVADLGGVYSAILLANHGPVVAGDTLLEAGYAIEELEQTAKLHLLLRHERPRLVPQTEVDFFNE